MNLSLRVLAAAAALMVAGVASATAPTTLTTATSGSGSDLIFIAFDTTTSTSFAMDLGVSYAAFPTSADATQGYTWNVVGTGSQWASFASAANTSSIEWEVVAANQSPNGTAGRGIDMTIENDLNVAGAPALSAPNPGNIAAGIQSYLQGVNAVSGLTKTQYAEGYFNAGSTTANASTSVEDLLNLDNNTVGAGNSVGQSAQFANYSITNPGSPVGYGNAGGLSTFTFNGSSLVYSVATVAAVPEPSSYAMMLAGLLMVGAMVIRRRDSK